MMRSRDGRAGLIGGHPAVGCRVVAAAAVQFSGAETSGATAPNDHLRSAPHSRMRGSRSRRASTGDCFPAICYWVIAATIVEVNAAVSPAPNNHAVTGPHCAVIIARRWRAVEIGCYPRVIRRVIAPAGIQNRCGRLAAPNNHLGPSPDRGMVLPRAGCIGGAGSLPAVCGRIITPPGTVYILRTTDIIGERTASKDDHFGPGPDGRVIDASGWRISIAGGPPGVGNGVVPSASSDLTIVLVEWAAPAPDNHFRAGPDR